MERQAPEGRASLVVRLEDSAAIRPQSRLRATWFLVTCLHDDAAPRLDTSTQATLANRSVKGTG